LRVKEAILAGAKYRPPLRERTVTSGTLNLRAAVQHLMADCGITTPSPIPLHLRVAPNPVENIPRIQVQLGETGTLRMQITTADGREVYRNTTLPLPPGRHDVVLSTVNFPPGMYLLRAASNNRECTRKFVVL